MDPKRFDELIATLLRSQGRRETLRGIVASVAAGFGFISAQEAGIAGKNDKRRKRRRQARKRRRRCLNACDSACGFCFYATSGEIRCGTSSSASCAPAEFCDTDADCGGADCIKAYQFRGSSEILRVFNGLCDYPVGICVGINPVC